MSHRPVSPKRFAANRANAAKSTGPRTPAGKARCSQNARKHIFTGSTFAVVRLEALREELPIEPIVEAQAEQTETTSGVFQTDPLAPENPSAPVAEGMAPKCQVPMGLEGADAFSCMSKIPLSPSEPGPWLARRRASF